MGLLEDLDAQLAAIFSSWNAYTTVIALGIVTLVLYAILSPSEPDTHPMLLLRQASAAAVRQPGESAPYRSHENPHGYPLKSGLNVRPPGAPLYSAGRDGDLRDVWRRVSGELPLELPHGGGRSDKGKILTVFGREKAEEVDLAGLGKEIAVVGDAIRKAGGQRVAVYLPNSTELLAVLFAGAFFGLHVILVPYNQPHTRVIAQLKSTNADVLIAEAGALPLADVSQGAGSVRQVVWVVEQTSRHMDWTEVPEDVGGKVEVHVWHELVRDAQNGSGFELPEDATPGDIVTFAWQEKSSRYESVEFTQKNIVAAVGALISAVPPSQRFNPSDLFLPADALTNNYTLCLTLAALFQHATVALNSTIAGADVDIARCAQSIAPTIIVASASAGAKVHESHSPNVSGMLTKMAHSTATRALQAGRMPVDGALARLNAPRRTAIGATPGKLRLLFLAEKAGDKEVPLNASVLNDLRVYTGARVVYAFTAPRVAGAVSQTSIYDYRTGRAGRAGEPYSHFGGVLSSVEAKVVDSGSLKTTDHAEPEGEIVVNGPAVAGGEARLGVLGRFNDDGTLSYVLTGWRAGM